MSTKFKRKAGAPGGCALLRVLVITTVLCSGCSLAVELTPPYFNLAEGRHIWASATCGEDTEGPELYCKLVGANAETDDNINVIQGQVCDVCDPNDPKKMHPPRFAVDGMETWWQSPPLSRGMKYNEVNLTIDLDQEFHVAYVYIRMGNSPRPGLWVLEKSSDYGKTYTPWQYFSDSPTDCESHFGRDSLQSITRDDSVICTTEYSQIVPLEGGEIPISLLNNRPSANNYFNSTVLQEWTRATNVRFRLLRTKNLLGHLMSVARQDPTVTRRYFYSIKDISIGGRCMCNGHADTCDRQDPNNPNKLLCRCQHNTCGPQCAECCSGFEQKAWRQSKTSEPFICEPCNCFNHANECEYDPEIERQHLSLDIHGNYEGGGVCQNCRHNTEGINCNKCKDKFYRPHNKAWNETDVCQPCNCDYDFSTGNCAEGTGKCECRPEFTSPDCDSCSFGYFGYPKCRPCECNLNGTRGNQCEADGGQCPCKPNYTGKFCNQCAEGYYNFPECLPCECNEIGALSGFCDKKIGNCSCKNNFGGRTCDQCEHGFYSYPECRLCSCDLRGSREGICDKESGECLCKDGYGDDRCEQCLPGYYGYPDCKPCNCSVVGSASSICDATGKCPCLTNFASQTCEQCSPGFYKYPECLPCNCNSHGAIGVSCDGEGICTCQNNFDNIKCDQCKEGFYNFPTCEECNCNPAGVVTAFAGCGSVPAGELCQCKDRVHGRICDRCRPLFWNLQVHNPNGCEECNCHIPGVIGGIAVCDQTSGQCVCKPSVKSRGCDECVDGTYNLDENNLFGCRDCECDIGGSVNGVCNKETGQCQCQPRINGRTCKEPLQTHYFPTLYQFQYEAEDGHTPTYTPARYNFDENVFANYSWKGYATFTVIQNEIIQDIYIQKSTLYRMVLRYVNPNAESAVGSITISPENPSDAEQKFAVHFKPTTSPAFVYVSDIKGTQIAALYMNPGRWAVHIKVEKHLLLDYFVLLPAAYYEATILSQNIKSPCVVGEKDLCRHYGYPNISTFETVKGDGGFTSYNEARFTLTEFYTNTSHLNSIGEPQRNIPLINKDQQEIQFELTISKPGAYVILVTYVTPLSDLRTHDLQVELSTDSGRDKGKAILYACPYTTVCRQAVIDREHRVATFHFDSNFVSVAIKGNNDSNVAISSVVAIPIETWSLDHIKPKPICIRKGGKCVENSFPNAPDSKKVQFEQGNEEHFSDVRPEIIFDNSSRLIYLDHENAMVDVRSKVQNPGYYVFVVHYYQPNHPEFDMNVLIQNGLFYEATLPIEHCPSYSGCRSVVRQTDGNTQFSLTENFVISLKEPNHKSVWLDYLLVIPADQYSEKILLEEKFDRTGEFITNCGSNHFNINTTADGFCRDAVYSLTADYNNGALYCNCDYDGSISFECNKFGGQCPCKPNVIGRQCKACKPGFYGFPDCKPCSCPSNAICDTATGECICPTHVTGENCDQCMPLTYGFDSFSGCLECNCNPLGVFGNNLQCDLNNGSCSCKENIVSRSCDRCKPGYYQFPYCEQCECDLRGTTNEICDRQTSECFCKANVVDLACDVCKDGTFNLQAGNEEGCTKCFCFGRTSRCTTSSYYRTKVVDMNKWGLITVESDDSNITVIPQSAEVERLSDDMIGLDLTIFQNDDISVVVYFSASSLYLGNKLTAYGGKLSYTIYYTSLNYGSAVGGADVILYGSDIYLLYESLEQPAALVDFHSSVEIVEGNFRFVNGAPATRESIMLVLEKLQGIYIRATYWDAPVTTRLFSVSLDTASEKYQLNSTMAYAVEKCHCPPNYKGLSCEECAPGYYRTNTGPYGGLCVPCQCNGHSDECDVDTGVCFDCKHNTRGEHCEYCNIGYHGDATNGTPMDCLICACPIPQPSNNFATACEVSPDGNRISCECNPGYFGARCESCAAGFYGRPEVIGDYCKPCSCSGNINPDEIGSCDSVTGECLKCLNNTYGEACGLCAPGYFGDAVNLKDCQSCVCDQNGTESCDSSSGQCKCWPNVIGEKCDRCELEHYGFWSGRGCLPCSCSEASLSGQCDDLSGQCRCQPGVTGQRCDRCISGYWNYTSDGCVSCGCNTEYSVGLGCNARTGQCECLQGVIGEKCDHCPYRWVLKPEEGCFECDKCVHNLLDVTDALKNLIDPVIVDFNNTASGYFTAQRLNYINSTVTKLEPEVRKLDPDRVDLRSIKQELESLEQDSRNLNKRTEYAIENAKASVPNSGDVKKYAEQVLENINNAVFEARKAVGDVNELTHSLEIGTGLKIDNALMDAQYMLDLIKNKSFAPHQDDADAFLKKAEKLVQDMVNFTYPIANQTEAYEKLRQQITEFDNRLEDLKNHSSNTQSKAQEIQRLNAENRASNVLPKVKATEDRNKEANDNIDRAEALLKNATDLLGSSKKYYTEIGKGQLELYRIKNKLNESVVDKDKAFKEAREVLFNAHEHAQLLSNKAQELDSLLSESREKYQPGLDAATAYRDIAEAIEAAQKTVESADGSTKNATALSAGLDERTVLSETNSDELLQNGRNALDKTGMLLQPQLDGAKKTITQINSSNVFVEDEISNIEKHLNRAQVKSLQPLAEEATAEVDSANEIAKEALEMIQDINGELPKDMDVANMLPKTIADTQKDLAAAHEQLLQVQNIIPNISQLIDTTRPNQDEWQQDVSDIEDKINKLNQLIAEARDEANRIKVGVKFFRNTTIQLKNPPDLASQSTSTKVSAYFRTKNPDGFLLYLGNEIGTKLRKTRSDDFMALEVENGYPVLTVDLGSGPEKIIGNKVVADDVWYQVIVERTGQNVKMTIREEDEEGKERKYIKEQTLQGFSSIFNLDQEQSKLFVGGYPPTFNIQLKNRPSSFEGEIEEVMVGEQPVSLWNFVDATGNNNGARERDKLNLSPSTGYRFGGKGYAVLNGLPYINSRRTTISLEFKTRAREGLLFLIGKDQSFLSLEIRNGRVIYSYKIGDNAIATIASKNKKNDGEWHLVEAVRSDLEGILTVDGEEQKLRSQGSEIELKVSNNMYFGGYPNMHDFPEVTNVDFDGCIDKVAIDTTPIDLSLNINAFDVQPGCPAKFARIVSFSENTPGFIQYPNATTKLAFQLTLKFKTNSNDGIIFYTTNKLQNDTLSLSLVNGNLILQNPTTKLITKFTVFNNSEWHVVTATHDSESLQLLINDYDHFRQEQKLPTKKFTYENIYFGGLPSTIIVPPYGVPTSAAFSGCIEDVTLNGAIVNFANSTEKYAATLGTCTPNPDITSEYPEEPKEVEFEHTWAPEPEVPNTTTQGGFGPDNVEINTIAPFDRVTSHSRTTPETPRDRCSLPLVPESDVGYDSGYRFGTVANSRIEYDQLPGRHKNKFEISLEFRTSEREGVIFYASDEQHSHFVALYMENGIIHFKFNLGAGPADIMSDVNARLNDEEWHYVSISRLHNDGRLVVDQSYESTGATSGKTLNLQGPYYLGGTTPEASDGVTVNLGFNSSFVGCVRNFKYMQRDVGISDKLIGVIPCSDRVERGMFFSPDGGYAKVFERFNVGVQIDIKMDIKPRNVTGILLIVHSRNHFLILQIVDGVVKLTVNNGQKPFEASFAPNNPFYLCDGNWHSIQAVKSKNVATLAVDNVFSNPSFGKSHMTNTKTGMFIGGHPHIGKLRGLSARQHYFGCIKNLYINDNYIQLDSKRTFGNVMLNVCPTN